MARTRQDAGRPLLPAGGRPLALLTVLACLVIVVAMGAWLAHGTHAGPLDTRVDGWLDGHLTADRGLVLRAKHLGNVRWISSICAALVLACLALRRYRGALLVAISAPVAAAITEFAFKPLFDRTLGGSLAFPSGHVTGVSAAAAAAVVLLMGPARPAVPAAARWLASAVALLAVLAVALSVVVGHYHYFTDTIGGACVGIGTVLATALSLDWISQRLTRSRAAAPGGGASSRAGQKAGGGAGEGVSEPARESPRA